jgi:predicted NAD/FAD-binding protein
MEKTPLAGLTMAAWLQRGRLDALRSVLAPYYVSWGYGYLEEVSALYVFKLMDFYVRTRFGRYRSSDRCDAISYIVEGYQRLWERIADPFELQLGTDIHAVRRRPRRDAQQGGPAQMEITIVYNGGQRQFDALLIACPFDRALNFLDADSRERRVMAQVRHLDFYTIAAAVEGLPPDALVFVGNHLSATHSGHVVSWYRRWPESNIVVFYALGRPGLTADELTAILRQDLAALGARVPKVHGGDHWRYFPHVSTRDIAAGYYRDFEALQGDRQTWYTGELLAFPTVEHVVAYSRQLVKTYF